MFISLIWIAGRSIIFTAISEEGKLSRHFTAGCPFAHNVLVMPTAEKICHPERLKKIYDFRKESKDLRTDLLLSRP